MMVGVVCAFLVVYASCYWLFGLPGLWKLIGIPFGVILDLGLGVFLLPVLLANLLGFPVLDMTFPVFAASVAAIISAVIMQIARRKKAVRP